MEDYIKTQQVLFLLLNLASLPFIGVVLGGPFDVLIALGVLVVASTGGQLMRKAMSPATVWRVAVFAIVAVAAAALVRSVALIAS